MNALGMTSSSSAAEQNETADHGPPPDMFPLPLTAFERLMLDDDRPGYPRTFTVIVEFIGQMQRNAFEEAILEVIRRNPLLSAVVRKRRSKLNWVATPFPRDHISWWTETSAEEISVFNLRKAPGFRVSGRTIGENSELHLVFHHAVSDGQGARRVILDWLTFYAAITATSDRRATVDRLDYDRLRRRGELKEIVPQTTSKIDNPMPTTLYQRCRTIYEFLSQHPTPVRSVRQRLKSVGPYHAHVLKQRFDRSEVNQFRDRLRGSRFTLNDVAIALLLNSIARWNREHGESGRDRMYRILVPVDLREAGDEMMPAANRLSFVFITRHTSLCLDWPRLLTSIRAEMDYIDENGCKYNLIKALPVVQAIPGIVPLGIRAPACFSTAVLTNLGETWRKLRHRFPVEFGRPVIGNLQFVRAGGSPPLRAKTGVGVGITMSLGEIVIHGRFDSKVFSQLDAEAFLQRYMDSWRCWAAFGKPSIQLADCEFNGRTENDAVLGL